VRLSAQKSCSHRRLSTPATEAHALGQLWAQLGLRLCSVPIPALVYPAIAGHRVCAAEVERRAHAHLSGHYEAVPHGHQG